MLYVSMSPTIRVLKIVTNFLNLKTIYKNKYLNALIYGKEYINRSDYNKSTCTG